MSLNLFVTSAISCHAALAVFFFYHMQRVIQKVAWLVQHRQITQVHDKVKITTLWASSYLIPI